MNAALRKATIPRSLRNEVWLTYAGRTFEAKCHVRWCGALITPFTFEVGHNTPESKGGATTVGNLRPICPTCNRSMGNRYSIDEFTERYSSGPKEPKEPEPKVGQKRKRRMCCFSPGAVDAMEED